jgi:hypothetical protein
LHHSNSGGSGFSICRSHVCPDNATTFYTGVAFDMHMLASFGCGGYFHAFAVAVKLESVVGTTNTIFFIATKKSGHTTVRAEFADQTCFAVCIAKR